MAAKKKRATTKRLAAKPRKRALQTAQDRDLGRYSQLWLMADEWEAPITILTGPGKGVPCAFIVNRKRA